MIIMIIMNIVLIIHDRRGAQLWKKRKGDNKRNFLKTFVTMPDFLPGNFVLWWTKKNLVYIIKIESQSMKTSCHVKHETLRLREHATGQVHALHVAPYSPPSTGLGITPEHSWEWSPPKKINKNKNIPLAREIVQSNECILWMQEAWVQVLVPAGPLSTSGNDSRELLGWVQVRLLVMQFFDESQNI